nr:tetratricopeptide repeat protein [Stenomitos frigidus]
MHERLQRYDTVAISGMGGIGKTELAVKYARTHLEQKTYPGGVVWLKAREDVASQIVLFARSLPMPQPPDDFELAEKVKFYWRNWQDAKTLVILDDVQDYGTIKLLLPVDPRFKILLTTRLTLQRPIEDFEITVLSDETAIELLRAIVCDERLDQNLAIAKQICDWLGYLPLGLELVGRYLERKPDISLETLWQRLQDKRLEAKALLKATPEMTATLGVAAAFELSWDVLDEPTRQLAMLLSLFALAEIPWTLVQACFVEEYAETLEDVRDEWLLKLHLLKRTGQEIYRLHQLLREFFVAKREQMVEADALKQAFRSAALKEAKRIIQKPDRSLLAETTTLMPHLQAVVHLSETSGHETDVAVDLAWLANLYYFQGRYTEAEPLLLRALTISEQQLGADHPDVAARLNSLANLYYFQGRYREIESLYQRALTISEQQLGADHPDVATKLNNLANLYRTQGRYAEAEPLYLRALTIGEQQLGADHPDVATRLNNLAGLYEDQGYSAKAEPLYLRALAISEQQLGADHPDVAIWLNNLANLYSNQGRYAEAEPRFLKALAISEQQLGADHPDVATWLNNLASLYSNQERYAEAEPRFLRALTIREQQLGENHPDIANSLNSLAELYCAQGRYTETEPLRLRCLEIEKQTLGENHPQFAASLNNLAGLYEGQGRYAEAETLYLRALAISEQQLGEDHPGVATKLNNLAALYKAQERYTEAEQLFLRALTILFESLGETNPSTQTVYQNFQQFLEQVLRERRTRQLSDHQWTRGILEKLAWDEG